MKQIIQIAFSISALIAMGLFLFMPDSKAPADGKIRLKYWMVSAMKEQPFHITEFNRTHNNIIVEPTPLPWNEHEKKILTSILSEDPPDLVFLVTPVAKWATRLALTSLDDLIKRDSFDSSIFFAALWDEMRFKDKIYALPLYSNSYAFFYNKKLFREAGLDPEKPPKTWDEVLQYSSKLAKKDANGNFTQMGFIPTYGNVQTSVIMAWELGAQMLLNDGAKVSLANKPTLDALNWIVNFYNQYGIKEISTFIAGFGFAEQHGFISEKLAMMVLDNSFPDQMKLYNKNLDYGVADIPTFEGYKPVSSTGSWWFAIPRGAKNKEAAWEFMKFAVQKNIQLTEAERQKELLFPSNKFAANDPAFLSLNPPNRIFVDLLEHSKTPTIVPLAHDVFWREYMGAQERAIHKIQSPIEALKQAEKTIQMHLDETTEYDNYVRSKVSIN